MKRSIECREIRSQLIELAYGELGAEESAAVRKHVKKCSACARRLARIEATTAALDQQPVVDQELDMARLCLALMARSEQSARRARRFSVGLAGLAAAAAIAGLLFVPWVHIEREAGAITIAWQSADDGAEAETGNGAMPNLDRPILADGADSAPATDTETDPPTPPTSAETIANTRRASPRTYWSWPRDSYAVLRNQWLTGGESPSMGIRGPITLDAPDAEPADRREAIDNQPETHLEWRKRLLREARVRGA